MQPLSFFVVLTTCALCVVPLQAATEVETLLQQIPEPKSAALSDAALQQARGRVVAHPELAATWILLGDALAQKQRDTAEASWYAPAELAYQQALKLDPTRADAMTGLAWVWGGRHDFTQSVSWAKKAMEADPQNASAHGIVGDAALELGDLDRAFESYQRMMDLRPDLSSYSRGAWLVWLTGDAKKGRWLMEKAIAYGSPHAENTAWCRSRLALMLFHEGALLPAAQLVEKAVQAAPANVPLLLMQARIQAAQSQDEAALATYQKILRAGQHLEALIGLGDLHAARGRSAEAEAAYFAVESLHVENVKNNIHDHMIMARFYADHDRQIEAAQKLVLAHKESQNVYDLDALAWVALKAKDLPAARKLILKALNAHTPDAEIHFHAGLIAEALGDHRGAQSHLSKALQLNPHFHLLHAPIAAKKLTELSQRVAVKE